jgi:hypothetical protein
MKKKKKYIEEMNRKGIKMKRKNKITTKGMVKL